MKEKILVLTSTFPRWERDYIPSFVYELSKRLAQSLEVYVLAPYSPGSKTKETIAGMKVHRFRYWLANQDCFAGRAILPALRKQKLLWCLVPFFLASQFFNLIRIMHKEKPGTIHAHWIMPQGLFATLYKKIFNRYTRVIITCHGADVFGLNFMDPIKRWILNNSTSVTVVSNEIKKQLDIIGVKRKIPVRVIPMGVDLALFNQDKYDEGIKSKYDIKGPFLLFVGRLTEKKGVNYLVEAMEEVVKRHADAKLLIIGYGEERDSLQEQAAKLKHASKNVIFLGELANSDLPPYYATADIFIGPSTADKGGDREGFGLVFVEAMGSSCAVIASDLPSISDIVIDGKTGLVAKQKNSSELSKCVINLLENKDLMDYIKVNGRQYVSTKFDWGIISENYLKLLRIGE